ncbi:MAG: DUF1592 domain-containing protein [Myxococcota bacterium]
MDEPPPPDVCAGEAPDPGPPTVARRLTLNEMQRTISTTLGVDVANAISQLPPDPRADGFTNNASTLVVTAAMAESFLEIAEQAANSIPDFGNFVRSRSLCQTFEARCRESFVEDLGLELFRRPLSPEQVARYADLFTVVQEEGDDFDTGARLVVEAMLQAPQFLYRVEQSIAGTSPSAVDGHEIASRLSFMVMGGPPDAALLELAEQGALSDPSVRAAEVDRLLQRPEAREHARQFFTDWFGLEALRDIRLSEDLYPLWSESLMADMIESSLRLIDDVIWESDLPLIQLYTIERTYLNERLAEVYELDVSGSGFQAVDVSATPERAGLLTQPSLLAAHAFGDDPSIVHRALFILHDVLCDSIPPPPDSVDAVPPETAAGASQRNASEDRLASGNCAGCHSIIDPLGYAFERFDSLGARRGVDQHGNTVRDDGVFRGTDSTQVPFNSVAEFIDIISASPRTQRCMVQQSLQFAVGRRLVEADGCTLSEVMADFESRGGRYRDLLTAYAEHPSFVLRRAEDNES